jgi:hypothetical protein
MRCWLSGIPKDLAALKRHAGHVLHAIDPSRIEQGPGADYGVIRAASGIIQHIEMAGAHETASENVATHATHVATSARNTVARAEEIAGLAERVMSASSAAQAAPLMEELAELTDRLIAGHDANGDGRIGWQEGEGRARAGRASHQPDEAGRGHGRMIARQTTGRSATKEGAPANGSPLFVRHDPAELSLRVSFPLGRSRPPQCPSVYPPTSRGVR